jgi:hypothetical protein
VFGFIAYRDKKKLSVSLYVFHCAASHPRRAPLLPRDECHRDVSIAVCPWDVMSMQLLPGHCCAHSLCHGVLDNRWLASLAKKAVI